MGNQVQKTKLPLPELMVVNGTDAQKLEMVGVRIQPGTPTMIHGNAFVRYTLPPGYFLHDHSIFENQVKFKITDSRGKIAATISGVWTGLPGGVNRLYVSVDDVPYVDYMSYVNRRRAKYGDVRF